MKDTITVILLNYFSSEEVKKYYDHMLKRIENELHFVIVDNSSDFSEWMKLVELFGGEACLTDSRDKIHASDRCILLKAPSNLGYAKGNNYGIKVAMREFQDKYVLISNSDLVFEENMSFDNWITEFERNKNCAVIGPVIVGIDGNPQSPCRKMSFNERWGFNLFIYPFNKFLKKNYSEIIPIRQMAKVYRIQGSLMFCDVKKFESVGFFDEHTFLYGEELILAERLKKNGFSIMCDPSKTVLHLHNQVIGTFYNSMKRDLMKYKSEYYYYTAYLNYPKIIYPIGNIMIYFYYCKKWIIEKIKKGRKR